MSEKDRLRAYSGKRHFDRTAEPGGERAMKDEAPPAMGEKPRFVVQIHDASTMHFDFRLEVESRSGRAAACCATLASWGYETTTIRPTSSGSAVIRERRESMMRLHTPTM